MSEKMSIIEKMIENGKVANSPVRGANGDDFWLLDGLIWVGKQLFLALAYLAESGEMIFVLVAICGFFLIMAGFKGFGNKMISGSILTYFLCKVVGGAICTK